MESVPVLGRVLGNPFGQAAATGSILGGVDAFTDPEKDVTQSMIFGAGAGLLGQGVGSAISSGVSRLAGAFNKQPVIPDANAIRAAKDAAYQAADDAGVVYTPQLISRIKQGIQNDLVEKGFLPKNQPRVAAVLDEIDKLADQNVTLKGLDAIRKVAGGAYDPTNKASNSMARDIIGQIDDAVSNAGRGDVLMGNAAAGAKAIAEARAANTQLSKLQRLAEAMTKAERNAASSGTGGNIDNAIRQQVKAILNSPAKGRGFTADEKAAMEQVVQGTAGQNAARLLGRLSPNGNGLMAMLQAMGAMGTGGATLPLVGVGMAAKTVADRATPANVQTLERIIRAGGTRTASEAPKNAVQQIAERERDLLVRALIGGLTPLAPAP